MVSNIQEIFLLFFLDVQEQNKWRWYTWWYCFITAPTQVRDWTNLTYFTVRHPSELENPDLEVPESFRDLLRRIVGGTKATSLSQKPNLESKQWVNVEGIDVQCFMLIPVQSSSSFRYRTSMRLLSSSHKPKIWNQFENLTCLHECNFYH